SLTLKNDGTSWAWGRNTFGQLGNGASTDSNVPVQVIALCQIPTGMEEENIITTINISPNPATTTIFIERNTANTPATLQLLDCYGRKVEEIKIAAGEKRAALNVKSFAAGFYFVRMVDEKEQVVRKVVVQH
ncbi:MAG: T9SS type A sorting domain-containing protein, partial [Bacteroidia bacterium]|nr:T9SS type A sorting domain-containing protein [Bacteroidia bacterium]